jgi:hypothetical protein
MSSSEKQDTWVFVASGAMFPGGLFSTLDAAEEWITRHELTGVLTLYPVDIGAYDWAVQRGAFTPKKPQHTSSHFVGRFTSALMQHHHYENGRRLA